MKITATTIPDVLILEPQVHGDHRGFFMETWRKTWFKERGIDLDFVQDNQSRSTAGILRGLHYQVNRPQGKLIRVIEGTIFDVAVDLRRSSPTFGRWVGVSLSAENRLQLWVPPGFAHGFYVTSEFAQIVYKCTEYYSPDDERILIWNDESIDIEWPLLGSQPVLSEKDANAPLLRDAELFP
ncbi:MAG: dTDP-4-dehydrorhamnose 3,5-epimerase [Gammaproteobacteria bacterium]|nr:dTDP-4-dehydrorhamnose 3,5-epimerase [Pseudomonadales bacterium]MCP5347819.1 dTDP-4-dehydrorhamnose 3,5-epimerase [Pseudomonadales bacterium]